MHREGCLTMTGVCLGDGGVCQWGIFPEGGVCLGGLPRGNNIADGNKNN